MKNKPSLKRKIIVQYKIILMDSMDPISMPTFIAMLTKVTFLILFKKSNLGQLPLYWSKANKQHEINRTKTTNCCQLVERKLKLEEATL
jgi:hypothetical protein